MQRNVGRETTGEKLLRSALQNAGLQFLTNSRLEPTLRIQWESSPYGLLAHEDGAIFHMLGTSPCLKLGKLGNLKELRLHPPLPVLTPQPFLPTSATPRALPLEGKVSYEDLRPLRVYYLTLRAQQRQVDT